MGDPIANRATSGSWRVVLMIAVVLAGVVVILGILVYERHANLLYPITTFHVVIATVGAIIAIAGLAGLLFIHGYDMAALGALTGALLVAGLAAALSIGVLFILLAGALLWFLARKVSGSWDWAAVGAGAATGVGVLLLTWVVIQPPWVVCGEDGATVSIPAQYSAVSGSATSANGREVGRAEFDGNTLSYECQDGELVSFELTGDSE